MASPSQPPARTWSRLRRPNVARNISKGVIRHVTRSPSLPAPATTPFVPQTISYDGDPFDVLVLGPPISGGRMVRGAIVGLLLMTDEKGNDAKVVISPLAKGRPAHSLTESDRATIGDYFRRYKLLEPDKFSEVSGWGSATDGLAFVKVTHAFYQECQQVSGPTCRVVPR